MKPPPPPPVDDAALERAYQASAIGKHASTFAIMSGATLNRACQTTIYDPAKTYLVGTGGKVTELAN